MYGVDSIEEYQKINDEMVKEHEKEEKVEEKQWEIVKYVI